MVTLVIGSYALRDYKNKMLTGLDATAIVGGIFVLDLITIVLTRAVLT